MRHVDASRRRKRYDLATLARCNGFTPDHRTCPRHHPGQHRALPAGAIPVAVRLGPSVFHDLYVHLPTDGHS